MRTFELSDGSSRKFWNIEVSDKTFTVTFGKLGTKGQSQTKAFKDAATAQAEADKLIREKTRKGYSETTKTALGSEDAAFQAALVANPDDLAGCAYADYLVERGDPRGEFMQTQIALEDEKLPKKERNTLKKKESALLAAHEKEWLGGLARFVLGEGDEAPEEAQVAHTWRRGVVSKLVVGRLNAALAQALAGDPAVRFVTDLEVHDTIGDFSSGLVQNRPRPRIKTPKGVDHHSELFELIGSPLLANLRVFQMGGEVPPEDSWCDCHTYTPGLEHAVASMSRVEVLHLYCKEHRSGNLFKLTNLTHLRELRIYHLGGRARQDFDPIYRLDVLASNPTFSNLTHLLFHPHIPEGLDTNERHICYLPLAQVRALVRSPHLKKLTHLQLRLSDMGDEGVREIIASGILKQLVWLDLRHGGITDEGAKLLAACPDTKRLECLDLSRNAVTSAGLRGLRKAGVSAVATNPITESQLEQRAYLCEGDGE
jgi:uncharacterized protein (TIGR02996 family)